MKHTLILLSYACCLLTASAAVPLRWTVETSRATPAQFEAYQGETLYFEADLQSAGKPLEMSGLAEFFWQTNGMGSAYWETTAAVNSNRLSAVFTPEMDVGARVYNCFIGVPGTIYHAAFQLRLRPSPGALPNVLPLPTPVIDFAKVRVLNPPWESGGGGGVNTNAVIDIIHKTVDGSAKMLPKYLWQKDFDDSYPAAAEMYYKWRSGIPSASCSAVRSGNFLYRNFDYTLDDRAEFVVRMSAGPNRFASVGVAQVGTNLTEEIVTSGKPSIWYKALPGATVDGINERGVVAEINVVDGTPPRRLGGDIHPLAAVRWALDNGTSAAMVASNLAARIQFPSGWTQNFHWMIADERETWIVENGSAHAVTNGVNVMTNFRLYGDPKDTTGHGQERYDLLFGGANITNAWYTRAYLRSTNWVSEFKDAEEMEAAKSAWETYHRERLRGHGLWQTLHTSVYDITNRVLRVAVQETDDWYTFSVPSAGGTDEAKVLEIAEAVVAPVASSVSDLQSSKADKATTYTKDETDAKLDEKIEKQAPNDVPARWAWEGPRLVLYWSGDGTEREVLAFDANSGGISIYGPPSGLTFRGGGENLESYIEEINYHISEKLNGSNPYGSGGVGWNDEAGFVFDSCRALIGYGSVLNAVSGDRIVFENDGNEETIDERIVRLAPSYVPSATDPTFSNAVLAVGLNIDTNSVAVLNEIAATFGDFPITGTATTVGGLLAALAAAVAWLRKNKIDKLKVTGMTAEATAENGVAKLDDFFKDSNSLLTGVIDDRLPIPISAKSAGFTTESYKRFVVTVGGDMTVTLHTPTSGDAEIFECRFNGASLSADASITFAGATATTMDTDCGTVKAGKVALMSAFWNGTTWDVNWKVEG